MALKKSREKADELIAKEEEIQQLQRQLEVLLFLPCLYIVYILNFHAGSG